VRTRGGNEKHRALRLESGNFAWGSEHSTRKTRIIGVVYNASNNELVRTNTIVKNCIVQVDAAPFRQWYEAHYAIPVTKKGVRVRLPPSDDEPRKERTLTCALPPRPQSKDTEATDPKVQSAHVKRVFAERAKTAKIDPLLESQFSAGRYVAFLPRTPFPYTLRPLLLRNNTLFSSARLCVVIASRHHGPSRRLSQH
jgi:small subunit ribosomal protein S8e